ncbi:hypothetical protein LC040_04555 [Bacillus tianshenii]|nr:hypothetical protein LC040_04555 [Bacillus tianshenii]
MLIRAFYAGTVSGIVLGLLLKWAENLTEKKVYTLLLNVDFIPVIGDVQWNEGVEFLFHLCISWMIAFLFAVLLNRSRIAVKHPYLTALLLTIPTIPLYFPLTILAIKETPAVDDYYAIFLWIAAHLLYALVLAGSYRRQTS